MTSKKKKILSIVLALVLFVSCFPTNSRAANEVPIGNQNVEKTYHSKDDFEDVNITSTLWETIDKTESGSITVSHSIAERTDEEGHYLIPDKSSKSSSNAFVLVRKEELPTQRVQTLSLDFKPGDSTYSGNASIVPLYVTPTDYVYFQYQTAEDGTLQVRRQYKGDISAVNIASMVSSTDMLSADNWIHLDLEYDYSMWDSKAVTLKYCFTDENGNSKSDSLYFEINCESNKLEGDYFQFGIGSYYDTPSYFDNITWTTEYTEYDEVPGYFYKYGELIKMTNWNASKESTLHNAAKDYVALSNNAKKVLTESDIWQNMIDVILSAQISQSYDSYCSKWSELLIKTENEYTSDEREDLEQALAEYNSLAETERLILSVKAMALKKVYQEVLLMRNSTDYSDYEYTFEDELMPFAESLLTSDATTGVIRIVEDPLQAEEEENNYVLKLRASDSVFPMKYWPDTPEIQSISFKLYAPGQNSFVPFYFVFYIDEDNYTLVNIIEQKAGGIRLRYTSVNNGDAASSYKDARDIDIDGWLSVSMQSSSEGFLVNAMDASGKSVIINAPVQPGGRPGFYFKNTSSSKKIVSNAYVDDFKVVLNGRGDYDIDDEPSNIVVYYTGNTFLNPGETMQLSGDNLYHTVKNLSIARVPDVAISEQDIPSVISQTSYASDGNISDIRADIAYPQFDASTAIAMKYDKEIVQYSEHTLQTVIPEQLQKGVYAVKLYDKNDSQKYDIVYVNRPKISSITGDEGDIATKGGRMEIVGQNLVPTGNMADVTVKLIPKNGNREVYSLPVTRIHEEDAYYLDITIPDHLPEGEYEVYVHNGYGDNTTWSEPCNITIGKSPRDAWPKTRFDVTAYGAMGDGNTNDTAAIINALSAAAENGGGVVYFPKGVYCVFSTLAIPENVVIEGVSNTDSILIYEAVRWQYNDTPVFLSILGNVELKNIRIQGTRCQNIISCYSPSNASFATVDDVNALKKDGELQLDVDVDNVYLTDVIFRFTVYAGAATSHDGSKEWFDGYTVQDVYNILTEEVSQGVKFDLQSAATNIQLDGVKISIDAIEGNGSAGPKTLWISGRQIQVKNCTWTAYSGVNSYYAALIQNNDMIGPGFNSTANGFYMYNNYLHDAYGNNRELMTNDGRIKAALTVQYIGGDAQLMQKYLGTDELNACAYLVTNQQLDELSLLKNEMAILQGQGTGQVRTIEKIQNVLVDNQKYSIVYVDKPFAINPNRNSKINVQHPRSEYYIVQNRFREGSSCGAYGAMVDSVFDGNEYTRHFGQEFAVKEQWNWYISCLNQSYSEAVYMHGDTNSQFKNDSALMIALYYGTGKYARSFRCFSYRNSEFDGYGILFIGGSVNNTADGILIEGCTFKNKEYALELSTIVTALEGAVIRNNNFETDDIWKNESTEVDTILRGENSINKVDCSRIVYIETRYHSDILIVGDVNLDGNVTLKDVTVLRFYLVGKIEIDQEQEKRADADKDGSISLKDVTKIRRIILGYDDDEWIGGDF